MEETSEGMSVVDVLILTGALRRMLVRVCVDGLTRTWNSNTRLLGACFACFDRGWI